MQVIRINIAGLMMFVILLAKQLKINPDNIATPIAAALGDLVTLVVLGLVCNFLFEHSALLTIF